MLLMIDNYDSFTFNLVQYLGELGAEIAVHRNDAIELGEVERLRPEAIIISPGPCTPEKSGISKEVIRAFGPTLPILGVCLGHQCIAEVFGAKVVRAARLMHGKTSEVYHDGSQLYTGVPSPFVATRYHSLIVERESLPDCFEVTAETAEGEIMGLRHKSYPVEGVQFHPESILTGEGMRLMHNFLRRVEKAA